MKAMAPTISAGSYPMRAQKVRLILMIVPSAGVDR